MAGTAPLRLVQPIATGYFSPFVGEKTGVGIGLTLDGFFEVWPGKSMGFNGVVSG